MRHRDICGVETHPVLACQHSESEVCGVLHSLNSCTTARTIVTSQFHNETYFGNLQGFVLGQVLVRLKVQQSQTGLSRQIHFFQQAWYCTRACRWNLMRNIGNRNNGVPYIHPHEMSRWRDKEITDVWLGSRCAAVSRSKICFHRAGGKAVVVSHVRLPRFDRDFTSTTFVWEKVTKDC
eukprot:scaffold11051_cov165-Amphora_coffeaeformis.AAC.15